MDKLERRRTKQKYKNLKVKPDTYQMLIRSKAAYEIETGEPLSMDGIIKMLLDSLPKIEVKIGEVKFEPKKGKRET